MIIKYIPEDFIVQEVLVTDHSPQYKGQPYKADEDKSVCQGPGR